MAVRHVVAVVAVRARVDRVEPQARHAQSRQLVEPAAHTCEVDVAVKIGVLEGLDLKAVGDSLLVPALGRVALL